MKQGTIVKGNRHEYKMTVSQIDGNKVTVNYFDSSNNFHTEEYFDYELEVL